MNLFIRKKMYPRQGLYNPWYKNRFMTYFFKIIPKIKIIVNHKRSLFVFLQGGKRRIIKLTHKIFKLPSIEFQIILGENFLFS